MPQAIDIVVVGNRAGFDAYMQGAGADVWAGFQAALEAAMPHVPEPDFNDFISFRGISGTDSLATDPTSLLPSDFQEAKTPSRFAKLAADTSQPSKRPIQTCCIYKLLGNRYVPPPGFDAAAYMEDQLEYAGEEQSSMYLVLLQNFLEAHPMDQAPALRFRYTDWVYCDGSCVEKAEGQRFIAAAVYTPPAEAGFHEGTQDTPQPPRAIAVSCHLEGDPDCMQGYNTINRAELAGILTAIQTNRHKHSLCVATDSLTSIHQIFTALTRPQDMREHRHQHLIQAIISAVQQHPGQVHLQKVKSHCGIMGNEMADVIAVRLAKAEGLPAGTEQIECMTPSANRSQMHWPHLLSDSTDAVGNTVCTYKPLPNLKESLQKTLHESHKFGSAPQDGKCFTQWQAIAADLDQTHSHGFITSNRVNYTERRLALNARNWKLPTQEMLHKWGKTKSPSCLLCGQIDTNHHAISGCPALSKLTANRHNQAGRLCLDAILQGRYGHQVIMADVGQQAHLSGMRTSRNIPSRIPVDKLPASVPAEVAQLLSTRGSRPDILMLADEDCTQSYYIIEIKYCADTAPQGQESRAEAQHSELFKLLLADDRGLTTVHQITLLFGVTGTIYKHTRERLEWLGVRPPALQSLLQALHTHAIKSLHTIWKGRAALISEKHPGHNWAHRPTNQSAPSTKRRKTK
jgi:ribonuclease HI